MFCEHFDAGVHRARIGVVRVVDEHGALRRLLELQTTLHGLHGAEAGDDLIQRDARGRVAAAAAPSALIDVVMARELQLDGRAADRARRD